MLMSVLLVTMTETTQQLFYDEDVDYHEADIDYLAEEEYVLKFFFSSPRVEVDALLEVKFDLLFVDYFEFIVVLPLQHQR